MSDGLYLYCIRNKTENAPVISIKGIDEGEVFIISYKELEAVVSKVLLEDFESASVKEKASGDLSWIKDRACIHELVIEQAMSNSNKIISLVPMRFGVIFKSKSSLEETIENDYCKIKEVLDRIKNKQEWSVKVYMKDKEKFCQILKMENEAIKEKEKEIASLPEGLAFFMEEELKEITSNIADKESNNILEDVFERIGKLAEDSNKNKILEKVLTGRNDPMVFNSSFLISDKKIDYFKKECDAINQDIHISGFSLEYSGPWPVYNFTLY